MKVNGPRPWAKVKKFIDANGRELKKRRLMLSGLSMLPNKGSHKTNNETDSKCYYSYEQI